MLHNWGITPEESEQAEREIAARKAALRDNRICMCGHPAKSHSSESTSEHHQFLVRAGRGGCRPSKMTCPCISFVPIIKSADVRRFIFKTIGSGPEHALARGIKAATEAKIDLEWVEGARCGSCKRPATEVALVPLALTIEGKESNVATPINVVFCGECRAKL